MTVNAPSSISPLLVRQRLGECLIVGDQQQRPRIIGQGFFESLDRGKIEVVGRLIEQETPGMFSEPQRQRDLACLSGRGTTRRQQLVGIDPERGDDVEHASASIAFEFREVVDERLPLGLGLVLPEARGSCPQEVTTC